MRTSNQDSYLRIVCVPSDSFSSPPTPNSTWNFFQDRAIPFGDRASGDSATCAKVATVKTFINKSPINLQPAVLQAVLENTYIDDGDIEATSTSEISELQDEIKKILSKGSFCIKSWECSGEDGASKYLGMTWNRLNDRYLLKLRLNLPKKNRGITSTANLDSEFLQDQSVPITKKNVFLVMGPRT